MSFGLTSVNVAQRGEWAGTAAANVVTGITVAAGNNSQALAVALTGEVNVIGTSSATASTGVRLPANVYPGDSVIVYNAGANSTAVYPATGGVINALTANAALTMTTGQRAMFVATSPSNWIALVSA